ncbi:MAG: DUF371 domain-containing protein [Candidatus Thorarchaeota archaeon]|nr:MAG: DUF371 domain-containing protein [Candidatus Thorarchaeota archaeon]
MCRVQFKAFGHQNIIGEHKTTVELTSEEYLSPRGTCIIGVRTDLTLNELHTEFKRLALLGTTKIVLKMSVDGLEEKVTGIGGPGLTYSDPTSMVARTSSYECGRTLMINADKAASDLSRNFVERLKDSNEVIDSELIFSTQ